MNLADYINYKDRELSYEDIRHYQNIIAALARTEELMREIVLVDLE